MVVCRAATTSSAIVPVLDIAYDAGEQCFMFAANRFRWEKPPPETGDAAGPGGERVHCGVCFDAVTAVRQRGLVQGRKGQIVSLLAIEQRVEGTIDLVFSAGIVIRLEVEQILCHVQDLDEPWPTQWRPSHPLED